MTQDQRNNGRNITRLVVSGGKRAEPRLMMAHPMGESIEPRSRRRQWLAVVIVIVIVIAIAVAGRSA